MSNATAAIDDEDIEGEPDDEGEGEPEPARAPPARKPARPAPRAPAKPTVHRQISDEYSDDAKDLLSFLNNLAPEGDVKVRVSRRFPRFGPNQEKLDGVLDTVEERIDEEYIRQRWGGGKYLVQISLPTPKGWQFGPGRIVDLSGPPKVEGRELDRQQRDDPQGNPLAERAISGAERVAEQERRRADKLEDRLNELQANAGRLDQHAMAALLQPLRDEIAALRQERAELQSRLFSEVTKPPPTDPFRDRLLQQAVDGESKQLRDQSDRYEQRLSKMRDDHAQELRDLRNGHSEDMKRVEARHDRTVDDLKRAHDRELADLKRAHDRELAALDKANDNAAKALEVANDTRLTTLKTDNTRLTTQITNLETELKELRSRKDKSPADQLKELAGLKESMDQLTGGGGDDDESPWVKLAGALANSEGVMALVDKIGGGKAQDDDGEEEDTAAAPAQGVQHPPVGTWRRHQGQLYQHVGNGHYSGPYDEGVLRQQLAAKKRQQQLAAQRRQRRQVPAAAPAEQPPATDAVAEALEEPEAVAPEADPIQEVPGSPPARPAPPRPGVRQLAAPGQPMLPRRRGKPPSPKELEQAVKFLEQTLSNKSTPEQVARTAQQLVPQAILLHIQDVGVDRFLDAVGQARPGTVLCTQHGRSFVRKVAALLFAPPA